jgi:hypothetical protein
VQVERASPGRQRQGDDHRDRDGAEQARAGHGRVRQEQTAIRASGQGSQGPRAPV